MTANLPLISMLKTKLHWVQARQKLLAQNVANADTPKFKPLDLKPPVYGVDGTTSAGNVAIDRTNPMHIAASSARDGEDPANSRRFETTPSGNAVNLEDEMSRAATNQQDFALVAALYQKSLSLLRTAAGRRG